MQHRVSLCMSGALLALVGTGSLAAQDANEPAFSEQIDLEGPAPDPAMEIALAALEAAPVFDGHNDTPLQLRIRLENQINRFDFNDTLVSAKSDPFGRAMHTDIKRLKKGRVGAQYWSVYVPASLPEPQAVQMTIEQIDVTKRLIDRFADDMAYAETADEVESAMVEGKIAGLLGMEGGHSIGSNLGVLRQMYTLGARYMTLTHSRNTPWADSATDEPEHNGLTDFGKDVVREMNRLGMLVDLSHVSEKTMIDALEVARAQRPPTSASEWRDSDGGRFAGLPERRAPPVALSSAGGERAARSAESGATRYRAGGYGGMGHSQSRASHLGDRHGRSHRLYPRYGRGRGDWDRGGFRRYADRPSGV